MGGCGGEVSRGARPCNKRSQLLSIGWTGRAPLRHIFPDSSTECPMEDAQTVVTIVGGLIAVGLTLFLLVDGIRKEELRQRERNQWICENWDTVRKKWKWEP
jgi:hypothetical protein